MSESDVPNITAAPPFVVVVAAAAAMGTKHRVCKKIIRRTSSPTSRCNFLINGEDLQYITFSLGLRYETPNLIPEGGGASPSLELLNPCVSAFLQVSPSLSLSSLFLTLVAFVVYVLFRLLQLEG